MAFSPPDSCLQVDIDGEVAYERDAATPLIPASTQKIFTARVALEDLGADTTYTTSVVASGAAANGVIDGDLTLVGSGDPVLVTDAYRLVRGIGDDEPFTSFDALAQQLADAGVKRITGRVLGDDSRYDQLRGVPSWPDRYLAQNQSGPLSALGVDDGYDLTQPAPGSSEPVRRNRSDDPPASAARLLTARLLIRGIKVDGAPFASTGTAPAGAVALATVTSPPLARIVDEMLLASDNQIAELLTKELGRTQADAGTTAAGSEVIDRRTAELGIDRDGSDATDGSGLDPGNRATCASLVSALEGTGGVEGVIGRGLPVAGETGTLDRRFRDTPAAGVLRAKTGSLNGVSALAGFVPTADGGLATFAYVANEASGNADVNSTTELLGSVLVSYRRPCPGGKPTDMIAPLTPAGVLVADAALVPIPAVAGPAAVVALEIYQQRFRALVDTCLAFDESFDLTLTPRGPATTAGGP